MLFVVPSQPIGFGFNRHIALGDEKLSVRCGEFLEGFNTVQSLINDQRVVLGVASQDVV
jgi:hypothetical protein